MSNILFFNFQTCIFKRECEPSVSDSVTLKSSLECYFVKICWCLSTPFEKTWLFKLETKGYGLGPAGIRVESPKDLASVPMCTLWVGTPEELTSLLSGPGMLLTVTLLKGVGDCEFPVFLCSCHIGVLWKFRDFVFSLTMRPLTHLSN